MKGVNRLGAEKSPYLLQHKTNPVWWYAWGEEAFEAAKREDKPVFLSIGYSTCYWCHVMEKDSFEREEVAKVLNDNFISIKLDREERPDIDAIYMQAVVGLTGHGGWPMSVFLTQDKKPFFGGTFFYQSQFIALLKRLHEAWLNERARVEESAQSVSQYLSQADFDQAAETIGLEELRLAGDQLTRSFDEDWGGFGGAPKFPPSQQVSLLLRLGKRFEDKNLETCVTKTLGAMARGGIYDHLGGGFHRYSTDAEWKVPHFEKMLYDNALLSVTYLEAYQALRDNMYAEVAAETLGYMTNVLAAPEGGFYAAQDAGEVGQEGDYYVWAYDELRESLDTAEFDAISSAYALSSSGNFEHQKNILILKPEAIWSRRKQPLLKSALQKLVNIRRARVAPHTDIKIITGWNGLAISAFAQGARILERSDFLASARACANCIKQNLRLESGQLMHRYVSGEAKFQATQEDYAFLIQGLIDLYAASFEVEWLTWAHELQRRQDEFFWDEAGGAYYYSAAPDVLVRKKEMIDGATPAGNSVAWLNLLRLESYFGEANLAKQAERMQKTYSGLLRKHPAAFCKALMAFDYCLDGSQEIALLGDFESGPAGAYLKSLQTEFKPNQVIAYAKRETDIEAIPLLSGRAAINGQATEYRCRNRVCEKPRLV